MCLFSVLKRTFLRYRKVPYGMELDETKIRVPSVLWIPLFTCAVLLYFIDVFQIQVYSLHPTLEQFVDIVSEESLLKGYAINTPGCKIPELDPFDKNIMRFIETPEIPKCNKGIPALFAANLTTIYLDENSLPAYDVANASDLKCCFRSFWRREPKNGEDDNNIELSKDCQEIHVSATIKDEFIQISCTHENSTIYKDMFAFVPVKNVTNSMINEPRPLNVLIIGLDAISRINLHRQMPKTVNYLKEIMAVELLGYNKVGDNTFPNLIPVLTGMSETELTKSCWDSPNGYFDNCSFIWTHYKSRGYVTAYGEDASWMGLFNYQRRGFKRQATDYAYNYFSRFVESQIGNSRSLNVDQCEGARPVYLDFLSYVHKFVTTMGKHDLPYFGFFWEVSLSHDYLNKPKLGDDQYYQFLKNFNSSGYMNNTALIFMSDHGIRWGGIRQTYQGRMEERLPFAILTIPEWYRLKYQGAYNNLRRNARRLTTPFDLHETLMDLSHPFQMTASYLEGVDNRRGISLFRAIPKIEHVKLLELKVIGARVSKVRI